MPVYVNGQARGSLDPDDPHWFLQTRKDALSKADVVLIFGTPLDFRLGYGRSSHINPAAKLIQVDLDGGELGRNRGCDVGIIGDTGLVMEALTDVRARRRAGRPTLSRAWLDGAARAREREVGEDRAAARARTRRRSTRCASAPRSTSWSPTTRSSSATAATSSARPPTCCGRAASATGSMPGPLGTLGVGPGYAMAAKLASPKSDVIIIYGDGAFGLHVMEFEACIRQKINIVGVIGNDAAWTQIRRGQVQIYGPERALACKLVVHPLRQGGRGARRPRRVRRDARSRSGPRSSARSAPASRRSSTSRSARSDFRKDAISV